MNIGIIGAGGIGSYYAGLMSRAGHSVRLIARGEHLDVIRGRGLEVRTPDETFVVRPDATPNADQLTGCEYVIVAVKGYSLGEVGPALAAAAKSGAAIVPLLNGIDVVERLESLGVPRTSIIGGLVGVSLFRTAPGVVERMSPFDRMVLGELDRQPRDRTKRLVEAFAAVGTAARVSDDISLDLWRKFAFIVPLGVGCGLARRPAGYLLATEGGRGLFTGALAEIVALSRTTDSPLTDEDQAKIRQDIFALQPGMRPSFLQDLERGGPTEVDSLAGAVSRIGRQRAVPTPIHDVATAAFESATVRVS